MCVCMCVRVCVYVCVCVCVSVYVRQRQVLTHTNLLVVCELHGLASKGGGIWVLAVVLDELCDAEEVVLGLTPKQRKRYGSAIAVAPPRNRRAATETKPDQVLGRW